MHTYRTQLASREARAFDGAWHPIARAHQEPILTVDTQLSLTNIFAISGVDRLFPRCLETPPRAQKRWGQAHREVAQRYIGSDQGLSGSSACAILDKRSGTRESYRGTDNLVAET